MTASQYKTVRPRKRVPLKTRTVKQKAPKSRVITHRSLGPCTVVAVFLTDAGSIVVDCDVAGVRRTLSLDPQFWLSDISTLALEVVKRKPKPEKAEPSVAADEETETDEPELVPDEDGHLRDGDQAVDEDEEVESEDGELVSADVLQ